MRAEGQRLACSQHSDPPPRQRHCGGQGQHTSSVQISIFLSIIMGWHCHRFCTEAFQAQGNYIPWVCK